MSKTNYAISPEKTLDDQLSQINALDNAVISDGKKRKRAKTKLKFKDCLISLIKHISSVKKTYTLASPELKQYYSSERLPEPLELIEIYESAEKYKSAFLSNLI
ncbi:MAG: hypothetical protein GX213_10305 [Clostridiaceae bacterium]|nr:hypothetical protein [Clostridiaceae bacterium]